MNTKLKLTPEQARELSPLTCDTGVEWLAMQSDYSYEYLIGEVFKRNRSAERTWFFNNILSRNQIIAYMDKIIQSMKEVEDFLIFNDVQISSAVYNMYIEALFRYSNIRNDTSHRKLTSIVKRLSTSARLLAKECNRDMDVIFRDKLIQILENKGE